MPIADPFSYRGRFDSMDLDYAYCKHFRGPSKFPDVNRVSRCSYHDISLDFELQDNGYKLGEWFCKHYSQMRQLINDKPLDEFNSVKDQLQEGIIYGGYNGKYLSERII